MYVCTYYVCMCVRTYVRMYICMYACMHVCMYVYKYVCMYACKYVTSASYNDDASSTAPSLTKDAKYV